MNDRGELQPQNEGDLARLVGQVLILVRNSGAYASERFVEYSIGQIRNPNTRQAYARAMNQFLVWCEALLHRFGCPLRDSHPMPKRLMHQAGYSFYLLQPWDFCY